MIRRTAVGHRDGHEVVVVDGTPDRSHEFQHFPGMAWSFAWATPNAPKVGGTDIDPVTSASTIIPAQGETRLLYLQIPPDSVLTGESFSLEAAFAEMAEHQPDMVQSFDPDRAGYHRTDTIDYLIVLEGEPILQLDGREVRLAPHDFVVQAGTWHGWRNEGDSPAKVACVLVGASRSESGPDA